MAGALLPGNAEFSPSHWTQCCGGSAWGKSIITWIPAKNKFCSLQLIKTSIFSLPQIQCMRKKNNFFFVFNVLYSKGCGSGSQISRYTNSLWICMGKVISILQGLSYYKIDVMCSLEGNYFKFRARSQLKS